MSVADDFVAARETFAAFEMPDRALVEFRGGDRARFLHNFCTNDINGLKLDQGCEAIFTNIKARAVGHGFVFAGADAHWLETTTAGLENLLQHLDKYLITDDVEITNHTGTLREILMTGPAAADQLAATLDIPSPEPLTQTQCGDLWLRRVDMWNQPGILIGGLESDVSGFTDALLDASPGDPAAAEALRLQAGFPQYGTDITDEYLAPEVARVKQTISYNKGCYLGQEPIARIDALGHVNRGLKPIVIEGTEVPAGGSTIHTDDGTEAGTMTSAAASPADDECYALAWLKREFFAADSGLQLGARSVRVIASG